MPLIDCVDGFSPALLAEMHSVIRRDGVLAAATGMDQATAEFTNSGSVTVAAAAEANGPNWGTADAMMGRAFVVGSRASNGDALSQLTNSGSVAIAAGALAEGEFAAATAAMLEGIVEQATAVHGRGRHTLWTGDPGTALYLAGCLEADPAFPTLDVW